MKTVLIYDQLGQAPLGYLVLKGDHSYFDGVYLNSVPATKEAERLQEKLSKLMYDDKGQERHILRSKFPVKAVREGAKVVVCGFIP